jgi:hypothetical protein
VTVRRDQEVSVTAVVSLTEDEPNEIASAFPPQWLQVCSRFAARSVHVAHTATATDVALFWSRLRFHLCVICTRRTIEPAPFEQGFDVGIASNKILK